MARRKPKFETAIVCDDIREEVGNKLTLIGIYERDILVSKLPYTFPKLCLFISCKNMKSGDSFSGDIINPSGQQIAGTLKGVVPPKKEGGFKRMIAVFSPLKVTVEGSHKLVMTFNEDDKSKQEIEFCIKLTDKAN